jgi:hypothetical protein
MEIWRAILSDSGSQSESGGPSGEAHGAMAATAGAAFESEQHEERERTFEHGSEWLGFVLPQNAV